LVPWFERQLTVHLRSELADAQSSELAISLLQAYAETNRRTLSFNFVVIVEDGESEPRVYRGQTTKINWIGSDGAIGAFVERAGVAVLEQLVQGEKHRCQL
jgi:hypothetical protein